jgi:hypothetical protein
MRKEKDPLMSRPAPPVITIGARERIEGLETVPEAFAWQDFEGLVTFIFEKRVETIFRRIFSGKNSGKFLPGHGMNEKFFLPDPVVLSRIFSERLCRFPLPPGGRHLLFIW